MLSCATGTTSDVLSELRASLVLWKRDGASWKSSCWWSAYTGGTTSHGAAALGAARRTALADATLCSTVLPTTGYPRLTSSCLITLVERMHTRAGELLSRAAQCRSARLAEGPTGTAHRRGVAVLRAATAQSRLPCPRGEHHHLHAA